MSMGKKKIDKKSERIVKKKGQKTDIIKAHPKSNTVEVRTVDKRGTTSKRSYGLSTKHGLSPKRSKKKSKSFKKKRKKKKK